MARVWWTQLYHFDQTRMLYCTYPFSYSFPCLESQHWCNLDTTTSLVHAQERGGGSWVCRKRKLINVLRRILTSAFSHGQRKNPHAHTHCGPLFRHSTGAGSSNPITICDASKPYSSRFSVSFSISKSRNFVTYYNRARFNLVSELHWHARRLTILIEAHLAIICICRVSAATRFATRSQPTKSSLLHPSRSDLQSKKAQLPLKQTFLFDTFLLLILLVAC